MCSSFQRAAKLQRSPYFTLTQHGYNTGLLRILALLRPIHQRPEVVIFHIRQYGEDLLLRFAEPGKFLDEEFPEDQVQLQQGAAGTAPLQAIQGIVVHSSPVRRHA